MTLTHIPAHRTSYPDRFENETTGLGYSVLQDTDAEDPRSNIPDEHAALWAFHESRLSNSVASQKPEDNLAIDAFARYYEQFSAEVSLELTRRYLRVFHQDKKLSLAVETIHGYSQSDWLEVVAAVEDGYGTPEDHISEFRMWAYGDVWLVIPDGKAGVSGIYADDAESALTFYREHFEDKTFVHTVELVVTAESAIEAQQKVESIVQVIHESDALPEGVRVRSYSAA